MLVVLANWSDLPRSELQSTTEEGQKLADELGAKFFEISCKLGTNCVDAFSWAVAAVEAARGKTGGPSATPKSSSKCVIQ